MKHIYTFLLIILIALLGANSYASTKTVSGTISSNTTWSDDTIYVTGDITIRKNVTLTINPGTQVLFKGHYKIDVEGCLLAVGNSTNRIVFTNPDSKTGWNGIDFDQTSTSNDSSKIVYCDLTNGRAEGSSKSRSDQYGGAIYLYQYSKVLIQNCNIKNNYAYYYGGGICCYYQSSPKIIDNVIEGNSSRYYGGGIWVYSNSSPYIEGNTISNNSSSNSGGGIDIYYKCDPTIINNKIVNNYAQSSGGGIRCYYYSDPQIINNLIANNTSYSSGGGIYIYNKSNPTLIGNTIANNHANSSGGGIYAYKVDPVITNCIVWGNSASSTTYAQIYPSSISDITYSNVEGGYSGSRNINSDPYFTSASLGTGHSYNALLADWSLKSTSPCIDNGSNKPSAYYPDFDLDGHVRIDADTIDIGAYEYVSSTIACGTLTSNTTWSGSVLLTCNVTVPNGTTLTIEPGTRVLAMGPYSIAVQGELYAVGTKDSFINFCAYDENEGWKGIRFSSIGSSNDDSRLEYCIVKNGKATGSGIDGYGGGIFIYNTSKVLVRNSIIANNYANSYGGGICVYYSASPKIINNVIVNNSSGDYGGGMAILSSSSPNIYNNTISKNYAGSKGGGIYASSSPDIKNCILWDNNASSSDEIYPSNLTVQYSDVEGGYTGTGNIKSDPQFKKPSSKEGISYSGTTNTDWSLEENSPCIDNGTPSTTGMDLPAYDLNGKDRVYSVNIDIGAYEDKSAYNVCGWINNDEKWDANKIRINCDVTIAKGAKVTIASGTVIEFAGDYIIRVNGQLIARGTSTDSIKFTAQNTPTPWGGISFDSTYSLNGNSMDSSVFDYCIFEHSHGIQIDRLISSNTYHYNYGAIYAYYHSKLLIQNSRFTNIKTTSSGSGSKLFYGAAISVYGRSFDIRNNTFHFNKTDVNSTGSDYGGAIYLSSFDGTVKNNHFFRNTSYYGGAMYISYSEVTIENNTFYNNYGQYGGAIYNSGYKIANFVNNNMANNEASNGGAIYITYDNKANLYNNNICYNKATYGGAIYFNSNADPTFKNCIIYGNAASSSGDQFYLADIGSDPKIYYSNIEGGKTSFDGTGAGSNYGGVYLNNLEQTPSFTNPSSGTGNSYNASQSDWSLQSNSPCINSGTPSTSGLNLPDNDLLGNPRIYNGRIEMGAYENQEAIYASCTINANTTWDADTVKVQCDVTINDGYTLTIMPGTFVEFEGYYKIDVQGTLIAEGNKEERITFSVTDTNKFYDLDTHYNEGGWKGIRFNSTPLTNDTSKLSYCDIKYAKGERSSQTYYYTHNGGALYIYNYSKVIVSNCLISNNISGYNGGAIFIESSDPIIVNNIIVNNSILNESYQYTRGGAIYLDDANPQITNNTIANNYAYYGGGIYLNASAPSIKNNIIYDNDHEYPYSYYYGEVYTTQSSNPEFYNNNIRGGLKKILGYGYITTYNDNIDSDPLFASPSSGDGATYDGTSADWSISQSSPCINAGGTSIKNLSLSENDFAGYTRIVADTIDIGAYEIQLSNSFITSQPSNATACVGSIASFSISTIVSADYQWYKDGVAINGASGATYVIPTVSTLDSGDYFCVLSNLYGSLISDTVSLTVDLPPTITSHPFSSTSCIDQSVTFSVTATGTAPLTYQWSNLNGSLSGGTSSSYTINSITANDASTYRCMVSNACGADISNGATLTLNSAPSISSLTSTTSICEDGSQTFNVTASGNPSPAYQWYKDGAAMNGQASSILSITNASSTDKGNYYCKATNICGADSTNIANLNVEAKPSITSNPSNNTICEGQSVSFSITATGEPPLTYQWFLDNSPISGATNNTYTISSVSSSDAGDYYCIATNSCGSAQSNDGTLKVNTYPSITAQSSNTSKCKDNAVTFSITATGSPTPTYQWYFGNSSISSATNNTYTISQVSTNDEGNYYCVATNSCGTDKSNNIYLTVDSEPSIVSQTSNTTICEGKSVTFSVTATGTAPLSYQWYDGNGSISGATNSTYTINSVSTGDAGTYYCKVTNSCATTTGSSITLTVNESPSITSQSSSATVCYGNTATFSVTATGTSPLSYQWYDNNGSISGATNNQYIISSVKTTDAGNYYCIVTNSCGTVQSTTKTLSVNTSPDVSYTTPNTTKCVGQSMSFAVNANGTSPLSYQWYYNSVSINGATNSTYTISSVDTSDAGSYYCIATNTCGTDQSTTSNLSINQSPSITSQSGNISSCSGQSATFSVTASGTAPLTYQWYDNNGAISSATNNQYIISAVNTSDAGNYYCIVSNSCGVAQSTAKALTVNTAPVISSQSSNTTKCIGESTTLNVNVGGTTPITYQWYDAKGAITGATNNFYTLTSISTADAGKYYCIATNSCGTDQSNDIVLTVNEPPSITTNTQSTTVCEGQSITFSTSVSGTSPITYQWFNSASNISGQTSSTYTINPVDTSHEDNYYLMAYNSCGTDQSNTIVLKVNSKPKVTSLNDSFTVCENDNLLLNVSSTGTSPITYQWYHNSQAITNTSNSFYLINSIEQNDSGSYTCKATNICGSATSDPIMLTVNIPLSIVDESGDSSKCENGSTYMFVNTTGTGPISYQWYNSSTMISGATSASYYLDSLKTLDADYYYCKISNTCGTVKSSKKNILVHKNPVVDLGDDTTFCYGGHLKLTPGSGYFCKWNDGSINPELNIIDSGTYYVHVTDVNGCTATSNTVRVKVHYPFNEEEICIVTVDSNGKNLIAWERTKGKRIAYYNVYKESTSSDVYYKIGSVPFLDAFAEFVDVNSTPKQKSDRYAITSVDSCGNESDLSPAHKTLHLTVNKGVGGVVNLIWDHYEGFTYSTYRIYRGTNPDSMQILDSIQSTLFTYTDLNPPSGIVFYQVSAVNPNTCRTNKYRAATTSGPFSQSLSNIKDYSALTNDYLTVSPSTQYIDTSYGSQVSFNVYTTLGYWDINTSANWLTTESDYTNKTITVTAISSNAIDYDNGAFITISGDNVKDVILKVIPYGASSINGEDFNSFMYIYPNPFSNETHIVLPDHVKQIRQIQLFSIDGKMERSVNDIEGNQYTLYKNDLSKGIYFLRVMADRTYHSKIIIR